MHRDYPLVCRWFISLARRDHFTSAVWKASNDIGFDAFHDFIKGAKKAHSTHSIPAESDGRPPQAKGKGQNVKSSKPATGSKPSSQQAPKKAATAESNVGLSLSLIPTSLLLLLVNTLYILQHAEPAPDHVIPAADLEAAKEAWLKGVDGAPQPRKREYPM